VEWLGEPSFHQQFARVFQLRTFEAGVTHKEPDHIPELGSYLTTGEGLNVSLRQRPQPSPIPPERAAASGGNIFDGRLASQESLGQHSYQYWIPHDR
jgi:hypothetical protein